MQRWKVFAALGEFLVFRCACCGDILKVVRWSLNSAYISHLND